MLIISCSTSYQKYLSSVLLQTLACEHQRMISGDVCKHFTATILPKCSDSIFTLLGGIVGILCAIVTNVSSHFPEDLNSSPLILW